MLLFLVTVQQFRLVLNIYTELHALTLAARPYALLVESMLFL